MDLAWPASARAHARGRAACCPRCALMAVRERPRADDSSSQRCEILTDPKAVKLHSSIEGVSFSFLIFSHLIELA